jgi:hypothetical protein
LRTCVCDRKRSWLNDRNGYHSHTYHVCRRREHCVGNTVTTCEERCCKGNLHARVLGPVVAPGYRLVTWSFIRLRTYRSRCLRVVTRSRKYIRNRIQWLQNTDRRAQYLWMQAEMKCDVQEDNARHGPSESMPYGYTGTVYTIVRYPHLCISQRKHQEPLHSVMHSLESIAELPQRLRESLESSSSYPPCAASLLRTQSYDIAG